MPSIGSLASRTLSSVHAEIKSATPLGLYINGSFVQPVLKGSIDVFDPNDGEVYARVPAGTAEDVDEAVFAAKLAFKSWGTTTGAHRAKHLRSIAESIREAKPILAKTEAVDVGKPLPEAEWDIDDVAGCFDYYAGLAEGLDKKQDKKVEVGDDDYAASIRYEPMGVVAAVVPWNYPMLMATWKVAAALAAGCTVVLKPSEVTPMTALQLANLSKHLPPGVLNVIPGTGKDAGAPLIGHRDVAKVAFTGSVPTGKLVAHAAAERVANVSLELGGKSPAIVFDDIDDLEKTVEWVMFGIFWTNGQICSATSRLLVHSAIADKFIDALIARTAAIKPGHPLHPESKLGPVVSKLQYDKVMSYIRAGKSEGATLVAGGGRPEGFDHGYYIAPTIFKDVKSNMSIWREEIFGPVLSIQTFDTEEEALALANDSEYGLAAAVFSSNEERLTRMTRGLETGIVWQNCSQPCFVQTPWGGLKQSGTGRDLGEFGLHNYLEPKAITKYVAKAPLGWYPSARL